MEMKGTNQMERRKHSRKTCFFAEVDYRTKNHVYTDPIRDISPGGVFIETENMLAVGEDLAMVFEDYTHIDLIHVVGDIVRRASNGVAVKFDIPDGAKLKNMTKFIDMV